MGPDLVRVGVFSPSMVLTLGSEWGVFHEAGFQLQVSAVPNSVAAFTALAVGELDMLITSPDNVLAYRLNTSNALGRSVDAQILLAVDRGLGLSLMAAPGITAPEGLDGQVLGVDAPDTGFAFAAYALLAAIGLPDRNHYRVTRLGTTPARRVALVNNQCAATMLNAGHDAAAAEQGCVRVRRVVDQLGPYLGSVLVALQGWTAEHQAATERLLHAWCRSVELVTDPRARDRLTAHVQAVLGCTRSAADLAVTTALSDEEGLIRDGQVREQDLQSVIDLRAAHHGFDSGHGFPAAHATDMGLVRRGQ